MGMVWTVLGLATIGVPAYLAARSVAKFPPGLTAVLAACLIAWVWLTVGVLVMGNVGWLNRGGLLGWNGLGCLLVAPIWRKRPIGSLRDRDDWGPMGIIAVGLAIWAAIVVGTPSLVFPVKVVSDGPIYHVYFAAKWWRAGRIFPVATPFGESAAPYFPAVGDCWLTWLVVLGGGDRLARVGQAPFLWLAAATTYASARRLGARPSASAIASAVFATVTPLLVLSFEPNVDTLFVAGYALSAYFATRYFLGDDGLGSIVLAGLAAGAAWGTKAPGIVLVPPLLGGIGLAVLLRPIGRGEKLRALAILAVSPFVMEGYWPVRNAIMTGNPLYPLQVSAFGRTILAGWYGPEAMPTSPYYLPITEWRMLIDLLLNVLDPRLVPLWGLALAGAWSIRRPGTPEGRAAWCWAGLAAVNVAIYWFVIPYRTQQRFLLQSTALAAVPLALLLDRGAWIRGVAVGLLALHVLTPQGWPAGPYDRNLPWDLSEIIPNAVPPPVTIRDGAGVLIGLGTLALSALLAKLRRFRLLPVAGLVGLVVVQAWMIAPKPEEAVRSRFPMFADYLRGWVDLDARTARGGVRIAYAGTNLPYYLMGNDFRNDPVYVNVDAHRGWLLHDYHRAAASMGLPSTWPDTRPEWDRMRPDYDAWLANLRAAGVQLLVVARANPAEGRHSQADAEGFTIERVWADAHPESFRPLHADPLFRTYAVRDVSKN